MVEWWERNVLFSSEAVPCPCIISCLCLSTGMFIMCVVMIFGDNAFRLQCKDFWVGGDPNNNHLSFSWGFEVAACILAFLSGGFLVWLVVLKARDDI